MFLVGFRGVRRGVAKMVGKAVPAGEMRRVVVVVVVVDGGTGAVGVAGACAGQPLGARLGGRQRAACQQADTPAHATLARHGPASRQRVSSRRLVAGQPLHLAAPNPLCPLPPPLSLCYCTCLRLHFLINHECIPPAPVLPCRSAPSWTSTTARTSTWASSSSCWRPRSRR